MSIDKRSGVSWTAISKVSGVSKTSIEKLSGVAQVHQDNLWLDIRPYDSVVSSVVQGRVGSRNATLYNGASVSTTPTGETSFLTDGVNDAVHFRITSASDKPPTGFPFTGESWLYRDDSLGPVSECLWGKPHNSRFRIFDQKVITAANSNFSSDGRRFFSRFYTNKATDSDNHFRAEGNMDGASNIIGNSSSSFTHKLSGTLTDTTDHTWYHVCTAWYEDGSSKLSQNVWINGVLIAEGQQHTGTSPNFIVDAAWPWEGTVSSSTPMSWGYGYTERFTSSDIYRNQHAGEFRMYTKKLTDEQVLHNFNATKKYYGY